MFRSLSDHHQGDTIFVLTSVTKIIDVAACLLHCNRHAATSITLVTEVKTNIVSP